MYSKNLHLTSIVLYLDSGVSEKGMHQLYNNLYFNKRKNIPRKLGLKDADEREKNCTDMLKQVILIFSFKGTVA